MVSASQTPTPINTVTTATAMTFISMRCAIVDVLVFDLVLFVSRQIVEQVRFRACSTSLAGIAEPAKR